MIHLSKSLCFLFSGRAGVGKTTSCSYAKSYILSEYSTGAEMLSIASSVKEAAKKSFGWNGLKNDSGRTLLQAIGKAGREYNENIWIDRSLETLLSKQVFPPTFVLVDDWRFVNEKIQIERRMLFEVIAIRIEAPNREILKGTSSYNDISEISLPSALPIGHASLYKTKVGYDYCINNTGSIETLYSTLEEIINLEVEKLKFIRREKDGS